MEKKYDIAAIGVLAYDMILRTVDASIFDKDTTVLDSVGFSVGGGAMISAIAAQRLGCKTAVVGKLAKDIFSQFCLQTLNDAGVDTSNIAYCADGPTSLTFALVGPDGERNFIGFVGKNNQTLCLEDFDLSVVTQAKIVSYGSFLVLPGLDQYAGEIFRSAHQAGALTVADCANDSFHQGKETVLRCLPGIDYFIPSEVEGTFLTGQTDVEKMAEALIGHGCRNLIIKLGSKGCFVTDGKRSQIIPTFPVENICDTTGAGDNFVGGFMAGLLDGLDLFQAARFANAVAAVSITGAGGVSALKDKSQVLKILEGIFDK